MRIAEPMTLVTDYVMGGLAVVFAGRLLAAGARGGQATVRLWGLALAATAVASLAGGTFHGFVQVLPAAGAKALWKLTQLGTGLASACILAAAVLATQSGPARTALLAVVAIKLAVYVWWAAGHDAFLGVIVDYAVALAGVTVLLALSPAGGWTAAARWVYAGVGVSVVAALIQALGLSPHPAFNHNDLFHVVQMVALYLLYRGGLLLRDLG